MALIRGLRQEKDLREMRKNLYKNTNLNPVFNPTEVPDGNYDVADLTEDSTNRTRINHANTDEVREYLRSLAAIVVESPRMAGGVERGLGDRRPPVVVAPYADPVSGTIPHDDLTIGILEQDNDHRINISWPIAKRMVKSLAKRYPVISFGEESIFTDEVVEDFGKFVARIDVLILPSPGTTINSLVYPLSAMSAGCSLIVPPNASYDILKPSAAVFTAKDFKVGTWDSLIKPLDNVVRRDLLADFAHKFYEKTTRDSLERIARIDTGINPV